MFGCINKKSKLPHVLYKSLAMNKLSPVKVFFLLLFFVMCSGLVLTAQNLARPKLVVGIVVDQMRWDYLYRYYDNYKPSGGFKRIMGEGFTCDNTMIPYTPTITAVGHTCVYTGSVPAITGITGNDWYDNLLDKDFYCTEDDSVTSLGATAAAGQMSPKNMLVTSICDELRLATNFNSKVIGIAIKDRGAILPAGHSANAAYWYEPASGNFISSTYYMQELPAWVQAFNKKRMTDTLYQKDWDLYLPKEAYTKTGMPDDVPFEYKPFGADQRAFPYKLKQFTGKDWGKINVTPYGNTLTVAMAQAAIEGENLGKNSNTDFLTVSFSSTDYIGHSFGPDSWEQMDDFARLDALLGDFLNYLDVKVGKGEYTVFLTADHGAAHVPLFSKAKKLPGGSFNDAAIFNEMNGKLDTLFGKKDIIAGIYNYQVVLNLPLIDSTKLPENDIVKWVMGYLEKKDAISRVIDLRNLSSTTLNSRQKEMISNGYYPQRCGEIQFILKPGYVEGIGVGTSHGLWNPYDAHIPLLWYGWGIKHGVLNRETYMTDIAPTVAALLHIQMPSGSIGKVIEEVINKN